MVGKHCRSLFTKCSVIYSDTKNPYSCRTATNFKQNARILKFECTSNTPRIIFQQVLSSTAYLILTNSLIYLDLVVRNLGTRFIRFQNYPIIPPLSTSIRFPVCVCVTRTLTVSEMQSEVAGLTCRTCLEDGFHSTGSRHFIPATNTGLRRSRRHIC